MKNVFDVLKQKEAEYSEAVSELRKADERAKQLVADIQAIKQVVKMLADAQDQTATEQVRALSQPQMIRAVLVDSGTEMHMADILQGVERKFARKLNPAVATAVIFRYAKRGSIFYKSKRKANTWGLLEWQAEEPKTLLELVQKVQ